MSLESPPPGGKGPKTQAVRHTHSSVLQTRCFRSTAHRTTSQNVEVGYVKVGSNSPYTYIEL